MKAFFLPAALIIAVFAIACPGPGVDSGNHTHYLSLSRFTDPGDYSAMLDELPDDVISICKIAEKQTVHHNLLIYHGLPYSKRSEMINVWPPKMYEILKAFKEREPYNLSTGRRIESRYAGGCINESHFLAGILRHKKIPARPRAGYFKNVFSNVEHFNNFWETNFRGKGVMRQILEDNPERWKEEVQALLKRQVNADKHFEHWICEYWDKDMKKWRMLDANTTFLKASVDIEVGYHLTDKHFEYAFEAWKRMRRNDNFNPDQHREDEQDGPSHIRAQLLWDFYTLLNHDLAGLGEPTNDVYEFVKEKVYAEVSEKELLELDELADLLSQNPTRKALVAFYRNSKALRIEAAERDPYSFVYSK